jgi:hypothetical protein
MYDGLGTFFYTDYGRRLPAYNPVRSGGYRGNGGAGGSGSGYGSKSDSGNGGATTPAPQSFQWSFPQYSQTWAFTPPTPTPYMSPPRFDPESSTGYAGVSSGKGDDDDDDKKSSGMSLMDLWKKYGLA